MQVTPYLVKKSFSFLSKTVIAGFIFSLAVGSLSPIPAKAQIVNTSLEAAPVNVNVETPSIAGEMKEVWISVQEKTLTSLPVIPASDNYWATIYNLETGEAVTWLTLSDSGTQPASYSDIVHTFVPVGINTYQAVITHGPKYQNPSIVPLETVNPIGKSEPFTIKREPVIASLTANKTTIGAEGATLEFQVNQQVNGWYASVYVFNITTGERIYWTNQKQASIPNVKSLYDKQSQYQVIVSNDVRGWFGSNLHYISEIKEIIATSNVITLENEPWAVSIKESPITENNIFVDTSHGGGKYATYLMDNSTRKIIWDSEDRAAADAMDIPNPASDLSGVTAYVAQSYTNENGEIVYTRPLDYNGLYDIIASSNGYLKAPSGVTDTLQVAGGSNPDENCAQLCHGDPINTATGEFFDTKNDISTVGNALVPEVTRSFSTIRKDDLNMLGYGWRMNYEMKISVDKAKDSSNSSILSSSFLRVENENGSVSSFYRHPNGTFEGAAKTQAKLGWDEATQTFEYIRENKETYTFNVSGKLVKIKNDRNQAITLVYTNDKLETVTDEKGNILTFQYNSAGLLASVTAQNGRIVTYTYDTDSQLISVINEKNITYDYTYDSAKRVRTLTNELGGITTNTYNSTNQVVEQTDPLGRVLRFEYTGNIAEGATKITYPNNKIIEETYLRGQLIKKIENFGQEDVRIWTYSYNQESKLVSTVNPDLTNTSIYYEYRGNGNILYILDENGNRTSFTYDAHNNILTITDPYEKVTANRYDSTSNLISSTTPLGEKTTFTYNADKSLASSTDARGNAVNANPADYTSTYSYLPNGLVSGITNALSGATTMTYNTTGDMVEAKDARGNKTKMENNSLGLLTKVIDPLQNETAMTYDQMGNVLTSINAKGAITTYTYDIVGNKLTAKNALNETITYAYNSMNKPTTITLADGTVQTITYDIFDRPTELKDQLLRTTKQEWDSNSRLTASINPDGGRTEYTYDAAGNLKTVKTPKGAVTSYQYDKKNRLIRVTDALGRSSTTGYDDNGRIIRTTAADGTTEQQTYDAVGNVIQTRDETWAAKTYTYDALNRKISFTNELGQVTAYSYDPNSNLVSQTLPDNSVVTYSYDERNLLTSIDYQGTHEDISYTYDDLGRKITEKKGDQPLVNYSYDSLNRLVFRGASNNVVAYSYDNVGNLLNLTYPSGRVVTYGYDAAAQLTQLNTTGVGATTFGYNIRSLQTTTNLANGVTESKAYDADSQLTATELLKGTASLYKRTQTYNLVGDVSQRGTSSNGAALTLENFTYDPVSRLTEHKVDTNGQTLNSYGYNSVGNLVSVGNKNQTYDASGKVTATGSAEVTYDARNNRTTLADAVDATKNVEYTWAQNNLLTGVTTHDGETAKTVAYDYSANNLLQSRTEATSTDQFVWDVSREIPAMLSDGKYEYVYSEDRTPLAQIEILTGVVTYLHKDLTGSVTASTNASGQLVGTVDFSPYGKPTGSLLSRFGYAGEWVDSATGYSYLKARWLDTETGTFLSEDPLVQITKNTFGYTNGNPITQIDPLGLFSFSEAAEAGDNWLRDEDNMEAMEAWGNILDGAATITGILAFIPTPLSPWLKIAEGGLSGTSSILSGAVAYGNCKNSYVGASEGNGPDAFKSRDECIKVGTTIVVSTLVKKGPIGKLVGPQITRVNEFAKRTPPTATDLISMQTKKKIKYAQAASGAIKATTYGAGYTIDKVTGNCIESRDKARQERGKG